MKDHFNILKTFTNDIKTLLHLKGDKVETIKEINSNNTLGKAYFLKQTKPEKINNKNENDNYIKILFNIYMNYKYIDDKINKKLSQEQFEPCYIVNKNYINKLKDIFKYKEFYTHKIKEIFEKYKTNISNFNELINSKAFYEEIKNEASQIQINEIEKHKFMEIKNDENLTRIKKNI